MITEAHEPRYVPGAVAYTVDGRALSPDEAAEDESRISYFLAGVWDQEGRLIWSSEPESYFTQSGALAAADRKILDLKP